MNDFFRNETEMEMMEMMEMQDVTHCYSPCQCLADWQYLESRQLADSIFECGCCKLGAQAHNPSWELYVLKCVPSVRLVLAF